MKLFIWTLFIATLIPTVALAQQSVTPEIASYETRYGDYGRYRGRAHNIRLAASKVSHVVLQPGETFSFNDRVGERTRANGFRRAPVIISGRMQIDYGGGICQLASTIHAAALYSGLKIMEHHTHTRVSGYIRPGLDATVDWETKDFVFQNSMPFPITMSTHTRVGNLPGEKFVEVTFTASEPKLYDVRIMFRNEVLEHPQRVVEIDEDLDPGESIVSEPGSPGMRVIVWRRMTKRLTTEEPIREHQVYNYPVSNRIVRVGPVG